ncbi:hypothetical protein HHK36_026821 [Tetracentron sinense]|uniref:Myb/SANT-like domain-containing protein n=1 Tax=Tetracentron sinense TaxID=13715 RepID=A0A834YKC4_TETSI|nr:hypothetical protein HHK36_026821 [Tetracentron sinense]
MENQDNLERKKKCAAAMAAAYAAYAACIAVVHHHQYYLDKLPSTNGETTRNDIMRRLVDERETDCRNQLRMGKEAFARLVYILRGTNRLHDNVHDTLLAEVDQELMMQEVTREGVVSQTNRSDDSREGILKKIHWLILEYLLIISSMAFIVDAELPNYLLEAPLVSPTGAPFVTPAIPDLPLPVELRSVVSTSKDLQFSVEVSMNIHQVETSSEKDKTKNLSWTQDMDNCLIDVLVVQAQLGLKVDKAFKGPAYTAACKEMNDKFQINCTTQHIKNRLKTIKKNFATLRELMRNGSGFSWNDMSKTFDAEPAVWRTYIDAHPDAKQFRYKPIHNYDKLLIVCGTDQATGVGAFTAKETSRSFREEEARNLDNMEDFVSLDKEVEGETGDDLADTCTQPVPASRTTSSSGLKRNNKRTRSSDVIAEKIEELGNKIEKLSESFDKSNINYDKLYEEIMKIEGVDRSFLMRAFDYVAENVTRAKVFLAYPPEERLEWLNMRMGH